MKNSRVSFFLGVLGVAMLAAFNARSQYVLGSFQGASDPNNAGWVDSGNSMSISTDPNATFPAAGVPGYPFSLQMNTGSGFGANSITLQFSAAQIAAFNANNTLTFTFSVAPGSATAGYSQIYNLAFNTPGTGYFNFLNGGNAAATWGTYSTASGTTSFNQNGMPNFYFFAGAPSLFSQTVTVNYSSILPTLEASEGFLQMTFQGNNGGGAPTAVLFNNVYLSSTPEPGTIVLGVLGASSLLLLRRRK